MQKQSNKVAIVTGGSSGIGLAPKGIRVNAVCPGPTERPFVAKLVYRKKPFSKWLVLIKNEIPVKKFSAPSDIAKLMSFISSDDASFIKGSEYLIDGGISSVPIIS